MVSLKYKESIDVWKKIKAWWTKVKLWLSKNKKILITIGTAFIAGFLTALRIDSGRNASIKRYIAELEASISQYADLNTRLQSLRGELEKRVESIEYTSDELRRQNAELVGLNQQAETELVTARNELADIKQRLDSTQGIANEISDFGGRLQAESEKLNDGCKRLEDFIAKYGA